MQEGETILRRRGAAIMFGAAGFGLFVCELNVVERLWGKGWGASGFGGFFGPYLIVLMLPLPLILSLVLRHRLKKWEFLGDVSAIASTQIYNILGAILLVAYAVLMELSSAR